MGIHAKRESKKVNRKTGIVMQSLPGTGGQWPLTCHWPAAMKVTASLTQTSVFRFSYHFQAR